MAKSTNIPSQIKSFGGLVLIVVLTFTTKSWQCLTSAFCNNIRQKRPLQRQYLTVPPPSCPNLSLNPISTSLSFSLRLDHSDAFLSKLTAETAELFRCLLLVVNYISKPDGVVAAADVVLACDAIDACESTRDNSNGASFFDSRLSLRKTCHRFGRYQLLVKLLKSNYDTYVKTAEFLSPSRIPREELPNVQDVAYVIPYQKNTNNLDCNSVSDSAFELKAVTTPESYTDDNGILLIPDCELENVSFKESPLDNLLLFIFRELVTQNTGGIKSDIRGIKGLVAQGQKFMIKELPEGVSFEEHTVAQHTMVKNTLGGLMTPFLPPFYRIFMSGIIPNLGTPWDGRHLGPWFYAPWLTSIVTPTFFGFLVGPSKPNRRSDGERGGLIVEKCKFLQESGCKGLCLHQCKIPAQEFFRYNLGMDLAVRPNFVTQECQWSFGEKPLAPEIDPAFPQGCLSGCQTRKTLAAGRRSDQLCM